MSMKGYKLSTDYKRLKEFLDNEYTIVVIWVHSTTRTIFAGIARRVPHIQGGVDGDWYSLDAWSYFPTIDKESFEDKCKRIGFQYIVPLEEDEK